MITMPLEYRSTAPAAPASKRTIIIAGGSAVFLVVLGVVLYVVLFSGTQETAETETIQTPVAVVPEEVSPVEEAAQDTIIKSPAYASTGELVGELAMTVPSAVAETVGASIGITVLAAGDITLPAGVEHKGGIYSLYPNGVAFALPISFEIVAADIAVASSSEEFYPATLRGTAWEEISGFGKTLGGWSFSFEKFPVGPIAVIRRAVAAVAEETPSNTIASSPDTDGDGLTDSEELLFGTSVSSADTDSDTYDDRTELMNDYSPLAAGVRIAEANLVATYTNPTYGYATAYPRAWLANALDTSNKQVLFISDTEEFFEILIEENPLNTPIAEWYRAQSPSLADAALSATVIDGVPAVWSADSLTLYVGRDGLVYILTYNKGTLEAINWPTVFEYFYKHFRFGNTATESEASAPEEAPA